MIRPDLINIVRHYRNEGVEEFGIFGMCFGAKVATLASIHLSDLFKASALVHPSLVTNDEARDVKIPMYLMPAMSDLDMVVYVYLCCGSYKFFPPMYSYRSTRYCKTNSVKTLGIGDSMIWFMDFVVLIVILVSH